MLEASSLQVAFASLLNTGFAWMVGVLWARMCVNGSLPLSHTHLAARLNTAMVGGLIACSFSLAMLLWLEAASMADLPLLAATTAIWPMLTTTQIGQVGAWALAVLLFGLAAHIILSRAPENARYGTVMALCIGIWILLRALSSHAAAQGIMRLDVAIEWLHLAFMGLWVGIVMVCAWLLPDAQKGIAFGDSDPDDVLIAMSRWATVALVGIVTTGLWNTNRVLTHADDLVQTPYGMVLSIKLGLVGLAIVLGAYNRFIGLPAASATGMRYADDVRFAMRRVVVVLRIESLVLLGVLIAAAALTVSAPPASS
jgi:putative copper resistance protein D